MRGCLSKTVARDWVDEACARCGIRRDDPRSWRVEKTLLACSRSEEMSRLAPRAWEAVCELLGGPERIADGADSLSDAFIINFCVGRGKPWKPPNSGEGSGLMWHKDGLSERHTIDDPLCALLVFILWSDVGPRCGGTFIALDSIVQVAARLSREPSGVHSDMLRDIGFACTRHGEITGKAGDVFLLHPYMLHTESRNPSGMPRFMTNKLISLKEPFCFNRRRESDYSPVEKSVLAALKLQRLTARGEPRVSK